MSNHRIQGYQRQIRMVGRSPFQGKNFRYGDRSRSRSPNRSFSTDQRNYTNNISQNNTSAYSDHLWNVIEEVELFPVVCVQMLKNEERNIRQFKKLITKQKDRVNIQIQSLKTQLHHIIEDYRLSIIAFMDRIYQQYITKYKDLKSEVMEINRLKQRIQTQFQMKSYEVGKRKNMSNFATVKAMESNQSELKKFHLLKYFSDMQKEKIGPLSDLAQYLMIITEYQNGFFQPSQFQDSLLNFRADFKGIFKHLLDEVFSYIRDPDGIVFKEQQRKIKGSSINNMQYEQANQQKQRSASKIKDKLILQSPTYSNQKLLDRKNDFSNRLYPSSNLYKEKRQSQQNSYSRVDDQCQYGQNISIQAKLSPYIFYEDRSQFIERNKQRIQNNQLVEKTIYEGHIKQQNSSYNNVFSNKQQQTIFNSNDQVLCSKRSFSHQNIKIIEQSQFSIKSKAMNIILCCVIVNSNTIAVGSKDGSLFFYDKNGNVLKAYQNAHKSALCTLKLIFQGQYLASGSDHPNPEIIIWNLNDFRFEQGCKFSEHKGAITAIQCLEDNNHIISGSYDKKMIVYSLRERKFKYNLPSNKQSVTAITINCEGSKLVSCCLQSKSLNVWQVVRKQNMKGSEVQTIFLQQVIQNDRMICSLIASRLSYNIVYIGTKDGKVKVIDLNKSSAVKSYSCSSSPIIEMLVMQQQTKEPLIICWPCKQKVLKILECQTGQIMSIATRGQLEFSCGVGPKAVFEKDGLGFIFCSQSSDRQIYQYEIKSEV